ncbi:MAG: LemA family protein [Piscinibacter sp.]
MSSTLVAAVVAAVLMFWAVGAYNRLVSLRGELLRCFVPVDEQFRARHALLLRWADTLPDADASALEQLRNACAQAETACGHARPRPMHAPAVVSLRLAEEILSQARARLPASGDESLAAALGEGDTTLAFARRQFNDAAEAYNRAVSQFPTWVIAGLFGFRKAGTL